MKKLFGFSLLLAIALAFASCSSNTPSRVVAKSYDCLIDKDYDSFTRLLYSDKEVTDEDISEVATLLSAKIEPSLNKKGGLKSYDIISEEINPESNVAIVKAQLEYGDGSTSEESVKVKKDYNDNWKIDMGK